LPSIAAHRRSKASQLAFRIEQANSAFVKVDRGFAFRSIKRKLLMQRSRDNPTKTPLLKALAVLLALGSSCLAQSPTFSSPTNIFAPASTPAKSIFGLSLFVLVITGVIFVVVGSLLAYAVVKFRKRKDDDSREPAQVYGSNQVEIAWTVIPILIVVVLFMATARVIANVQKAAPDNAVHVTVIGHQFWWEYRYPGFKVVTANELHVPAGAPTEIKLLSADTDHSFWVPRLAGKTDLIPNHPNVMWIDPQEPGLYLGQCAQYCGVQHAKMLLRVYVESPAEFDQWIRQQSQPAQSSDTVSEGRRIFEATACVNCHAVAGTPAQGRFGPDLTHLMSRETIAAGIAENNHENLRLWIKDPSRLKPGSLMPAMGLNDNDLNAVTAYLATLR
jgi:cytochrome c oxidase subunit 2